VNEVSECALAGAIPDEALVVLHLDVAALELNCGQARGPVSCDGGKVALSDMEILPLLNLRLSERFTVRRQDLATILVALFGGKE